MSRRIAVALAFLGILFACTTLGLDGGTSERATLERQKARWARQHLSSYRFTYSIACFCGNANMPMEIEVRANLVTDAAYTETEAPVPLDIQSSLPTIDALFRVIERAIVDRVHLLDVTYHPEVGYPTRISIDRSFNAQDDEITHTVSALAPMAPQ